MQTLSKEVISFIQCIPRAILLILIMIPAYLFVQENGDKTKEKIFSFIKRKWQFAFLFYLSLVLISAIFTRSITNPYESILANFGFKNEEGVNPEIVINILFFIPLTILYIQAYKPVRPLYSALSLSVKITLFIEMFQLIFWVGKFQFSDIVHNIIGGLIGGLIWVGIIKSKEKHLFMRIFTWAKKLVYRKE